MWQTTETEHKSDGTTTTRTETHTEELRRHPDGHLFEISEARNRA
jgi:hypothetical protein